MAITNWNFTKFDIWVVLYWPVGPDQFGQQQFIPIGMDLADVEVSYKLNELPSARMSLAIGREVTTQEVATIHYIADGMTMTMPVQVWLQGEELASSFGVPTVPWPIEPIVIFEGYTSGLGFSKNQHGRAGFTLSAKGWLEDLSFSSALSRSSHVTNPAHYYAPAGMQLGSGVAPGWTAGGLASSFFSQDIIRRDIWANANGSAGILAFLLKLTEQDMFFIQEIATAKPQPGQMNSEARGALFRFEPIVSGGYQFGVPLALRADDLNNSVEIEKAISADIAKETFAGQASSSGGVPGPTLWDKIVGSYSPHFLFSVVPMVDRALVVPFLPGLRFPWQIIYAEDYDTLDLDGDLPRALRAVGVFTAGPIGTAGLVTTTSGGAGQANKHVGGYYENKNLPGGIIMLKYGPTWLSTVQGSDTHSMKALNPDGVGANALNPNVGPVFQGEKPLDAQQQARRMINAFARTLYLTQILNGRSGTLHGRPRLDIAPGSTVQIIVSEEKFVAQELGEEGLSSLYATVTGITNFWDSERKSCGSNMLLSHIRTEEENRLDSTSIDFHPIWRFTWSGAPLHPHPLFIPAFNPFFGVPEPLPPNQPPPGPGPGPGPPPGSPPAGPPPTPAPGAR